jgi:hypothetical protein
MCAIGAAPDVRVLTRRLGFDPVRGNLAGATWYLNDLTYWYHGTARVARSLQVLPDFR